MLNGQQENTLENILEFTLYILLNHHFLPLFDIVYQ